MLEIIALTLDEAIEIENLGGTQIELISGFAEGGLTPSCGLIEKVIKSVTFPVNVMLRPHSRSFHYSQYDLDVMKEDAKIMDKIGVKNVVLGILDEDGLPDLKSLEYVLRDTNLTMTYHRAFDESSNLLKSLEILKSFDRVKIILTSGGNGKAIDNLDILKRIIENSGSIEILVGSGVNVENMDILHDQLDISNFHVGTAVRGNYYNNKIYEEELLETVKKYKEINVTSHIER